MDFRDRATLGIILRQVDTAEREAPAEFRPGAQGQDLVVGDRVRTDTTGNALVTYFEGTTAEVSPSSVVTVERISTGQDGQAQNLTLQQLAGEVVYRLTRALRPGATVEIRTPSAVATVRGTALRVTVGPGGETRIEVFSGKVEVAAGGIIIVLYAGTFTDVLPGQPPTPAAPFTLLPSQPPISLTAPPDPAAGVSPDARGTPGGGTAVPGMPPPPSATPTTPTPSPSPTLPPSATPTSRPSESSGSGDSAAEAAAPAPPPRRRRRPPGELIAPATATATLGPEATATATATPGRARRAFAHAFTHIYPIANSHSGADRHAVFDPYAYQHQHPQPTARPRRPTTPSPHYAVQHPEPDQHPSPTATARPSDLVAPFFECVIDQDNGRQVARFGYENRGPVTVQIPIGPLNSFSPGAADRGQGEAFRPGRVAGHVNVQVTTGSLEWTLGLGTASIPSNPARCSPEGAS